MALRVTKIQLLSDTDREHPLYYCHSSDQDHDPIVTVEQTKYGVALYFRETLYKAKKNPQRRNRIDIYIS